MVQIQINIYKVVTRYTFEGKREKSERYFVNLEKATAFAEKDAKFYESVALHELAENEEGELKSTRCIKVW